MPESKRRGIAGENAAAIFLKRKRKMKILARNFRYLHTEIDIIAQDADSLVFVEVKTRTTDFCGSGFEAITKAKYEHIKTGLFTYLKESKDKYKNFRIDAISIILTPSVKINHLKNI